MRLGTCVAFELLAGIGFAAGIGFGASYGASELREMFAREAQAAELRRAAIAETEVGVPGLIRPVEQAPPQLDVPAIQPPMFEGVRDDLLVAPLREARVTRVKFNRGGSSISLRLDFENGARAAFKPQQINFQTVPRREVAAYRINRLLGLASVAPAIGRKFKVDDLIAAVDSSYVLHISRLRDEAIVEDGWISGELSWWIPVILQAKIDGYRVDGLNGIVTWKRYLTVGNEIPEDDYRMASQISNMVLFDHLINNSDRFTGGNVRASKSGEFLYFMDNTLSFGISSEGHERTIIYLKRSQKFSRSLVQRMRALTFASVKEVLSHDLGPFPELLSDEEIRSLLDRRDYALAYIDELIELHGIDAVLVFP
jgi:hypothetical protein